VTEQKQISVDELIDLMIWSRNLSRDFVLRGRELGLEVPFGPTGEMVSAHDYHLAMWIEREAFLIEWFEKGGI